jgi:hypothetical protein
MIVIDFEPWFDRPGHAEDVVRLVGRRRSTPVIPPPCGSPETVKLLGLVFFISISVPPHPLCSGWLR